MAPKEKMPSQTPTEKNKKSVTEHVKPATPKEQAIVEERRKAALMEMVAKGRAKMEAAIDLLSKSSIADDLAELIGSAAAPGQLDEALDSFLRGIETISGSGRKFDRKDKALRFKFLMSAVIEEAPNSPQMEARIKRGQITVYDLMKMGLAKLFADRLERSSGKEKKRWQGVMGTCWGIFQRVEHPPK